MGSTQSTWGQFLWIIQTTNTVKGQFAGKGHITLEK